ncbi:DinB family protein [Deinococcus sonorensis]|uniref:DinB family protein n=2 Tax=Deinococcus sonorensis TaxID=309891 RepID=A0AAU7U9Q4_9DEIO
MTQAPDPPPLLGPSPEALELLLDQGSAFVPPGRALDGLSAEDACRPVGGSPHTVAELVAHLRFWQQYTLALGRGEPAAPPAQAADGWPSVDPDGWDALRASFLDGLEDVKRLAREADLTRLVRGRDTLGHELTLHALHNAVHLGQVILLRRMLGAWPPPGGGDTW